MRCPVFLMLSLMVSMSSGLMDLRLMTSTLMPSLASSVAASNANCTEMEWATTVMS